MPWSAVRKKLVCAAMKFGVYSASAAFRGLGLLALLAAGTAVLVQLLLPARLQLRCLFHAWTGLPCPGCGASRCGALLLEGRLAEALAMEPLLCCAAAVLLPGMLYLGPALLFGWPIPCVRFESDREKRRLVAVLALALLANWIYLMTRYS